MDRSELKEFKEVLSDTLAFLYKNVTLGVEGLELERRLLKQSKVVEHCLDPDREVYKSRWNNPLYVWGVKNDHK